VSADTPFPLEGQRIWVAGHRGMAGAALVRRLELEGAEILAISRQGMDLRRQKDVEGWIAANRPDAIVLAAGTVAPSDRPADLIYDNLAIAQNVIDGAWRAGVERLLYVAASAVYPCHTPRPIAERALLAGPPAPEAEAYALAKIAGLKLVEAYRAQHGVRFVSAIPTEVFGPGVRADGASLEASAVSALMLRLIRARQDGAAEIVFGGSGRPLVDPLHVDDLADACALLLARYDDAAPVNVGGAEVSLAAVAATAARVVGYDGQITFDPAKGGEWAPMRLDSAVLRGLDWRPRLSLEEGLRDAYFWLQGRRPDLLGRGAAA